MSGREADSKLKPIERWVLRAGALAAALASIAGVVTLLWPDAAESPRQTAASLRRLVVDPNICCARTPSASSLPTRRMGVWCW